MAPLVPLSPVHFPALVASAGDKAQRRFLEFFAANLRNPNTRRAYVRAVGAFLDWCDRAAGVPSLDAVEPLHVAAWIEGQTRTLSAPTVKQQLAAVRHLFDWLVTGQVVAVNPAASVRGPSHVVKVGKTPVLDAGEARRLLDGLDPATHAGLRDRALIGLMVYSFARIGAALGMKVGDVYTQNRRLWVRLREKGGKRHAMPCHHNLEEYLSAYLDGTGLRNNPQAPLFQTIRRGTHELSGQPLPQANAHAMVRRRVAAGIGTYGYEPNVDYFFGFPRAIKAGGAAMNLPMYHVTAQDANDPARKRDYLFQVGLISSALEHAVPEQMFTLIA